MLGAAELVLSTALSMPVVVFLAVDFWLICPGSGDLPVDWRRNPGGPASY